MKMSKDEFVGKISNLRLCEFEGTLLTFKLASHPRGKAPLAQSIVHGAKSIRLKAEKEGSLARLSRYCGASLEPAELQRATECVNENEGQVEGGRP